MKNILVLDEGKPAKCEFCGKLEELRPYGPNNERICLDCATKTPEAEAIATRKFQERIAGQDIVIIK